MSHYITAVLSIIVIVLAIAVNTARYPAVWQMMADKIPCPTPTSSSAIPESQEPSVPLPVPPATPAGPDDTSPAVSSPASSSSSPKPTDFPAASAVEMVPPLKTSHAAAPIPFAFFRE